MFELLINSALMLGLGIILGRHLGQSEAKQHMVRYMNVVSQVYSVISVIHEKHGLQDEVRDALKEHGLEIQKVRTAR